MNIEDDFMWVAGNAFSEMRLLVEGAITLFEDDAGVLCRLAREAQKNEAQLALNDIGTACTLSAITSGRYRQHITRPRRRNLKKPKRRKI